MKIWNLPLGIELVFRHPSRFWWVLVLAIFLLFIVWEWRKRNQEFKKPLIELHRLTSRFPSAFQRIAWWTGCFIATVLVISAYANPEKVEYVWERIFERIRITFILDISRSAKEAEDILPNRLEAEKQVTRDFTEMLETDQELKGRYNLALIPFSGAALPYYLPFTTSKDEFISHLDAMDIDTVTRKGTSLWAALRAFDELLLSKPARDKETVDLGILISDGGKEEGKRERALLSRVIDDLRDPYRMAIFSLDGIRLFVRAKGIQRRVVLNTVGIGKVEIDETGKRVAVPAPLIIRDKSGNIMGFEHVKEDDPKSPVLTSTLDEQILREVAEKAGGAYRHFSDRETILREFKNFVLASRKETDRIPHPQYVSVRAWFLVPAFAIFYFLFGYGGWIFLVFQRMVSLIKKIASS